MPKYSVSVPITGYVEVEVEAADEDAAKEEVWKALDEGKGDEPTWEYCDQIVRGNCFNGLQNEIEVTEIDE